MFCIIRVRVHAHVLVDYCYVATVDTASDTIATSIMFGDCTKCCCNLAKSKCEPSYHQVLEINSMCLQCRV